MKASPDTIPAQPNRWHWIAVIALVGYWLAVFGSTHVPSIPFPPQFNFFDKVCHFVAFAGLTTLAHLAWSTRRDGTSSLRWQELAKVMCVIAIYGAFDEISQPLVGRSCELLDWIADLTGILFATMAFAGIWTLARRRSPTSRQRSEAPATKALRALDTAV